MPELSSAPGRFRVPVRPTWPDIRDDTVTFGDVAGITLKHLRAAAGLFKRDKYLFPFPFDSEMNRALPETFYVPDDKFRRYLVPFGAVIPECTGSPPPGSHRKAGHAD